MARRSTAGRLPVKKVIGVRISSCQHDHRPECPRGAAGKRAVNNGPNTASSLASEAGIGSVASGTIGGNPVSERFFIQAAPGRPRRAAPPGPSHHGQRARHTRPADPDRRHPADHRLRQARLAPPRRAHRAPPRTILLRLRPAARLPRARPDLRLRYQGSADRWAIGIYLASSDRYTESELPTSFGPKTGTPEEGVDDTFILYAGPKTGCLRPSARTRPRPQKCETRADTTGPSPSGVPSWRGCVLPEDDSAGYRETSTAAVVIIPGEDG
jgi:hypothetical protein